MRTSVDFFWYRSGGWSCRPVVATIFLSCRFTISSVVPTEDEVAAGVNQTRKYRSPSNGAVQWSCFHPSNSSGAYRTPYEFPSTKRPPPSKSPSPTQKGKTLSRTASAINVRCELRVAVNSTVGRELAFFVLVFWWCAIGPEDAARTSGHQGQECFQFENGGYELGKEVVGHRQS